MKLGGSISSGRTIFRIGLISLCFVSGILTGRALDFSTTNVNALNRFYALLESSNRPVTVLSFGDSMADSYRSPTYHVMQKLVNRFGIAGFSLNNYRNSAVWTLESGATSRGPDYFWYNAYSSVPPGGAVWWNNLTSPGGIWADRVGVFYISQTNGGSFRLMISTNNSPWETALTLDGYSVIPQGHFATVTLPLNRYRVRIESDSGTNFIIGPSVLDTATNGIHAAFTDWGGIALNQVTNVPLSIREPIFAALQPDLIVWHMKEPVESLATWMEACEAWWQNSAPDGDVLYLGTTWISVDTNTTTTIDQNTIVRTIALEHNRAYVDLMTPSISYQWLVDQGYMQDPTHVNPAGGLFCANIIWSDLGLFAVGENRRINLQPLGNQMQLSYQTSTNARYRLEISSDLKTWTPIFTNPVVNATFTTNFTPETAPAFYRLNLTAP